MKKLLLFIILLFLLSTTLLYSAINTTKLGMYGTETNYLGSLGLGVLNRNIITAGTGIDYDNTWSVYTSTWTQYTTAWE